MLSKMLSKIILLAAAMIVAFPISAHAQRRGPAPAINGQPLRAPATVTWRVPVRTPSEQSAETTRKLEMMAFQGVYRPEARMLRTPIWLTPQHPVEDSQTEIILMTPGINPAINWSSSGGFPYGRITIPPRPDGVSEWGVMLQLATYNWEHRPTWLLVECIVAEQSDAVYVIGGDFWLLRPPNGAQLSSHTRDYLFLERGVRAQNRRIWSILEPPVSADYRTIYVASATPSNAWDFGGCEITPFNY